MKKIRPIYLLSFIGIIFFFSSCSKNSATHIPKDSFAVVVIDGKEYKKLMDKNLITENEEYKNTLKQIENKSKKLAELVVSIINKPDESGILFSEKIYAFAQLHKENLYVGIIIPIKKKLLDENIDLIGKELNIPINMFIKEKNDIKYAEIDKSRIIGWNKDAVIMLYTQGGEVNLQTLEELFNLKKSENILSLKDFKDFHKECKAFNIWISSNVIENTDFEKETIKEFEELSGTNLNNNYGHLIVDINKGEIAVTAKLRVNESIQNVDQKKLLDNSQEITNLLQNKFLEILDLLNLFNQTEDSDDYNDEDIYYNDSVNYELSEEEWNELMENPEDEEN